MLIFDGVLVGYYTICTTSIPFTFFPTQYTKGSPRYPVGAGLIAKLAIHSDRQGEGYGVQLLFDAIERIYIASKNIGAYAVVVDAKNEKVKGFYLKYGFISFVDKPLSLFMPLSSYASLNPTLASEKIEHSG